MISAGIPWINLGNNKQFTAVIRGNCLPDQFFTGPLLHTFQLYRSSSYRVQCPSGGFQFPVLFCRIFSHVPGSLSQCRNFSSVFQCDFLHMFSSYSVYAVFLKYDSLIFLFSRGIIRAQSGMLCIHIHVRKKHFFYSASDAQ